MKIGITGVHSSGKTTLLNALRSEAQFKNYSFCTEITRWVKSLGFPINEDGTDSTQTLIMMKHIYNLYMFDNFVTDRTAIDGYVYSQWLFNQGKLSKHVLEDVYKVFHKCVNSYDYILLIRPEFDIENDGTRSTDIRFRDEIDTLFQMTLDKEKIKYYQVSGSVRERVEQVLNIINKDKTK